jgi:hypothetical protein
MVVIRVFEIPMSRSLWNMTSLGIESNTFLEVDKETKVFCCVMSSLLNSGLEGEDMINGLVL